VASVKSDAVANLTYEIGKKTSFGTLGFHCGEDSGPGLLGCDAVNDFRNAGILPQCHTASQPRRPGPERKHQLHVNIMLISGFEMVHDLYKFCKFHFSMDYIYSSHFCWSAQV